MILEAKNLMRPIFVIGTGRCGLTPLMHLISYHQDLAWLSQYNNQFPNQMFLSYLSRIVEWPIFSSSIQGTLRIIAGMLSIVRPWPANTRNPSS